MVGNWFEDARTIGEYLTYRSTDDNTTYGLTALGEETMASHGLR
jgi:hypothetical protein